MPSGAVKISDRLVLDKPYIPKTKLVCITASCMTMVPLCEVATVLLCEAATHLMPTVVPAHCNHHQPAHLLAATWQEQAPKETPPCADQQMSVLQHCPEHQAPTLTSSSAHMDTEYSLSLLVLPADSRKRMHAPLDNLLIQTRLSTPGTIGPTMHDSCKPPCPWSPACRCHHTVVRTMLPLCHYYPERLTAITFLCAPTQAA